MKLILDTEVGASAIIDPNGEIKTVTTAEAIMNHFVSSGSSFDTGFLPCQGTGLVRYRQSGLFSQLTYQTEPENRLVKWGDYERDTNAEVFSVPVPYNIFVVDYHKDLIVGLRHFWTLDPIDGPDTPLYHTAFPNTNCKGYNNTSVGWVCLYRRDNTPLTSIMDKIQYAYRRESGIDEPYNDANMSGTDGPRFYKEKGNKIFQDGKTWKKLGVDYNFNTNNLIEIKTDSKFHEKHSDSGTTYTIGKATNDFYYPYYPSSMSKEEKSFYDKGWKNASSAGLDLTPKDLSKLNLTDLPQEIDPNDFVKNFGVKIKPDIDLTQINYGDIAQFVFNMRKVCAICNTYAEKFFPLVLNFNFESREESEITNKTYVYKNYSYVLTSEELAEKDQEFEICAVCIGKQDYILGLYVEEEDKNGKDIAQPNYFLTERGAQRFVENNPDWSTYMEDQQQCHYFVKAKHSLPNGLWNTTNAPDNFVITCACGSKHFDPTWLDPDYTLDYDNCPFGSFNEKSKTYPTDLAIPREFLTCNLCVPAISSAYDFNSINKNNIKYPVSSTKTVKNYVENSSFRYYFTSAENLSVLDIMIDGIPNVIIDNKENIDNLKMCQCQQIISDDVNHSMINGLTLPVCDGCNVGGTYVQLIKER